MSITSKGNLVGTINIAKIKPILQSKVANPSITEQIIQPDENYDALDKVTINAMQLQNKNITIAENGNYTITPDENYDGMSNISLSIVIPEKKIGNGIAIMHESTSVPEWFVDSDFSNVTNGTKIFNQCSQLTTIPLFDTSHMTNVTRMFDTCIQLTTIPLLNFSNIENGGLSYTFNNCPRLSNESLNNIMKMCIATKISYPNQKKLSTIGLTRTQATTCQSLSNYQDFINAGWSTGY